MKEITEVAELRSIQIAILDDIVGFCERNQIKYSLCGGTLIGALRHKGYIPWDDDIDIYMMRAEYDRFLTLYNKEQEEKLSPYRLLSPEITNHYLYSFGKVVDTRTVMHEDEVEGYELGVYVDVFPIDYCKESEKARKRQFWLMNTLYKMRRAKKSYNNFMRSALSYYGYKLFPLPVKAVEWLENKFVFLRKPTALVSNMHNNKMPITQVYPADFMERLIDLEFEGKMYKAMEDYDTYLRRTYKFHYMTLPPEDQRIHHHFKAWWK